MTLNVPVEAAPRFPPAMAAEGALCEPALRHLTVGYEWGCLDCPVDCVEL